MKNTASQNVIQQIDGKIPVHKKQRQNHASQKQRKLLQLITENLQSKGKPETIGKLMIRAGYAKGTAKQPSVITESKSFIQLLDESGVTDERLSIVMNEGLRAEDARTGKPDHNTRHKYLKTALDLKGHTPKDAPGAGGNTYNTFIQQNNLNPNEQTAQDMVNSTLDSLMQQTKAPE